MPYSLDSGAGKALVQARIQLRLIMRHTGIPRVLEIATPWDPAVGPCLGSYGGPRGGAFSYERGTPVIGSGPRTNSVQSEPNSIWFDSVQLERLGGVGFWQAALVGRNVQRFRGGLAFKAHRLCVSLNSRLENNKKKQRRSGWQSVACRVATQHPEP